MTKPIKTIDDYLEGFENKWRSTEGVNKFITQGAFCLSEMQVDFRQALTELVDSVPCKGVHVNNDIVHNFIQTGGNIYLRGDHMFVSAYNKKAKEIKQWKAKVKGEEDS